jgi:hypothetical protein
MQKLVLSRGNPGTRHLWRKSVRVYDVICVWNDKARARDAWVVFAFKQGHQCRSWSCLEGWQEHGIYGVRE